VDGAHVWAVGSGGTILKYGFNYSTGIPETPENSFHLFPNPANDYLWVQKKNNRIEKFSIYSIRGQLLKEFPCTGEMSPILIDLVGLNAGVYILQAGQNERKLFVKKQ